MAYGFCWWYVRPIQCAIYKRIKMISSNSEFFSNSFKLYVTLLLDRGGQSILSPVSLSGVYLTPILILLEHKGGGWCWWLAVTRRHWIEMWNILTNWWDCVAMMIIFGCSGQKATTNSVQKATLTLRLKDKVGLVVVGPGYKIRSRKQRTQERCQL